MRSSFLQFDLVCSESIYGTLAVAAVFLGFFFGAIIIGPFTDKFGRKPTIFISGFFIAVFSLASSFPKIFSLFVVFKIIVGLGVGKKFFQKFKLFSYNSQPRLIIGVFRGARISSLLTNGNTSSPKNACEGGYTTHGKLLNSLFKGPFHFIPPVVYTVSL